MQAGGPCFLFFSLLRLCFIISEKGDSVKYRGNLSGLEVRRS